MLRSDICFASGIVFDSLRANKIPLKPKVLISLLIYQKYHASKCENITKIWQPNRLPYFAFITKKVVEMFEMLMEAKKQDKIDASLLTLAAQVTDANAAFFDPSHGFEGCIPGVHETLRRQGLMKGIWCLNPEEVMSEGQADEITRVHDAYPHLHDDDFVNENIKNWK